MPIIKYCVDNVSYGRVPEIKEEHPIELRVVEAYHPLKQRTIRGKGGWSIFIIPLRQILLMLAVCLTVGLICHRNENKSIPLIISYHPHYIARTRFTGSLT